MSSIEMLRCILCMSSMFLLHFPAFAQTGMMKSESDYFKKVLFLDCTYEKHNYEKIDDELLRIKYRCYLSFEDNPGGDGLEEYMILQIGTRYSKFTSPILHAADSAIMQGNDVLKFSLFKKANPIFVFYCYYTCLQTGELTFDERFITEDFEYKETLPLIEWTITDERRSVCGYLCNKATGHFRGRDYIVWYTEDIPVSAGPWKLRGLPGVILYAQGRDNECLFEACSIKKGNGIIEKPDYPYINISRKQYLSLLKQYLDKPGKFSRMHMSRTPGITATQSPGDKETPTPIRPFIILEKE